MPKVSPFTLHIRKWRHGCGNDICKRASNVCHMRGELPNDVTFIGEAPGESENETSYPFTGPAGILLDQIIEQSIDEFMLCEVCGATQFDTPSGMTCRNGHGGTDGRVIRKGFCNLVGCIPYNEEMTKVSEPDMDQVERCSPRLQELVSMALPRLLVCVGKLAWDNLNPRYKQLVTIPPTCKVIEIVHPAAILRAVTAQRPFMVDRCVTILRRAVEEVFNGVGQEGTE
jgi:uracil-DNA glycosylase